MSRVRTVWYLCLSALAATGALIGTGWSLRARAGQGAQRPFVPRPSDLRPLSRGQNTAPSGAASSGGRDVPARNSPSPAKGDEKQKVADIDLIDPTLDEKTGVMTGRDFTYREDDMIVTGAKARYNKNSKILEADGNLVLDDPKHHVTGDKARYNNSRNSKVALITGTVVIVLKPKEKAAGTSADDVSKEKSKGGTIYCDRLEYYRKKDFVVLNGHLTFKQNIVKDGGRTVERMLTAEHAEYDGKVEKMHLFAPVDGKDTDGQEFHFDKDVFVGTKEGEETVQSSGHGKFIILPEEEKDEEEKPGGSPAASDGKQDEAPSKKNPQGP